MGMNLQETSAMEDATTTQSPTPAKSTGPSFLGLSTLVLGTFDGVHGLGSGCIGFARRSDPSPDAPRQLRQVPYRLGMISQFNLGGHFGCVHRVFVAETIAPLLREDSNHSRASAMP